MAQPAAEEAGAGRAPRRRATASGPTVRPPLPPRWAFGHIKSKDEFKGRQDILNDVAWMEQNDVPCQVIHIDAPWAVGHNLFEFASAKVLHSKLHPETVGTLYDFGAPGEHPYMGDPNDPRCGSTTPPPHTGQSLIDTLHGKGIRLSVWITNQINNGTAWGIGRFEGQGEREAPVFAFAERNGFLSDNMRVWHRGAGKTVNYANPKALEWWHRMMDKVLDMGVDGFVLDHGGQVDYVRDTFGYLREKKGDEAMMMSRSAPDVADVTLLVWAIDTKNDFSDKGIEYAVRQVIRSSEAGTPFVSGTQSPRGDKPSEAFVCREVQFNAFCPVHFTFCYGDLSNPWDHGETTTRVFKYYTRLHNELIPYIYSAAIRAHRTGRPIIRRTRGDLQYLFGPDFLVAPVYRDETRRRVTFPEGDEWIDYWDESKVYKAGDEIDYAAPLDRIPLLIRAGAIIPMEVKKNWTGHGTEHSAGALTVLVYPSGSAEREYLEQAGDTMFHCRKAGGYLDRSDVRFGLQGPKRSYVLRVKTFADPVQVRLGGGTVLPRRESETQLKPDEAAWCCDPQAGVTVVRLPAVNAAEVTIQLVSGG
ncbi:MAG: hypothetical protein HY718_18180 [Planctomycetes bacterium]|nr:hypothetical protein [Planctomycetota bacterium]